jgi:hypothetical protein
MKKDNVLLAEAYQTINEAESGTWALDIYLRRPDNVQEIKQKLMNRVKEALTGTTGQSYDFREVSENAAATVKPYKGSDKSDSSVLELTISSNGEDLNFPNKGMGIKDLIMKAVRPYKFDLYPCTEKEYNPFPPR